MNDSNKFWSQKIGDSPLVALAIHSGHELRAELQSIIDLDENTLLREEDPYTDRWAQIAPTNIVVHRSRFEVDLNRPREKAVYKDPEDAWGLSPWSTPPDQELIDHSLVMWDRFYEELRDLLSAVERTHGRFVLLDFHSYNHRRSGPEGPEADPDENPLINLGTGTVDRSIWGSMIEKYIEALSSFEVDGRPLDVRENVKFQGGYLSQWVHENFPESGCVLAIEVKKTFMDEWSGELFPEIHQALYEVFDSSKEVVLGHLSKMKRKKKRPPLSPSVGRPMRIGFVVNDIGTEESGYTTVRLAMAAKRMGHEIYMIGVEDLAYHDDETIKAYGVTVPRRIYKSGTTFLKDLKGKDAFVERITVDELDVLMLRNDPAQDVVKRPWAANAGILFGRVAMRNGVIVLNDPDGLAKATSKMYFQTFPSEIRPETIITRNRDDIRVFAKEKGTVVLKPLTGSGGQNVFMIRASDLPNLNQIIDSVLRDGYAIVQEYLPEAEQGDIRLFVMNGEAFRYKGHYCAYRRLRSGGDLRSNLHAGGTLARAELSPAALELVEMVRPKLIQDGMFLVGLDIVGSKLMEINVFSPGGVGSAQKFEGVNFAEGVIKALERKTQAMSYYQRQFDNLSMSII